MKRPNNIFEKKYISSLVIAAFLILSVLTAYNIKTGEEGPEASNTEVKETAEENVKETIGSNDDVIESGGRQSAGSDSNVEETQSEDRTGRNDTSREEDDDEERTDETTGNGATTKEAANETGSRTAEKYSYDGKNDLTWPLIGNIILPYSMDTTVYYTTLDQYACNDGILIGAKVGDDVVAAADGRVVNVFDSDRYGQTVTVLIGDYYEVSYSQVENVRYDIGDEVREGDVLAAVAEPTRAFSLEGPHLFFKMTYKGEPVNPTDYLKS